METEAKKDISVSVIISTLNEEKYIKSCLESIRCQNIAPLEVIVVDSNSEDKTIEVAGIYADKVISVGRKNISHSRNVGASVSAGDILMFVDADIRLRNDFLETVIKLFKHSDNPGAISGVFRPLENENNFINRFITEILINGLARFSLFVKRPHITGGAFAFRRNIFLESGGFNEDLQIAEDTEIFRKISKLVDVTVSDELVAATSMRRFRGLSWMYDWILGSAYYELTGKSLVVDYKAKR